MFNLEPSIAEWRRQMMAAGIKNAETLDELESHLREDVERRMRAGATADQAFREAVVQVGTIEELQSEFSKISRPQARLSGKVRSFVCAGIAVYVFFCEGWYLMNADISTPERVLELAMALVFVAVISCYIAFLPTLNRLRPGVPGFAWRRAVGKTCAVVLPVWIAVLYLNLANLVHFPSDFFLSAVCWSLFVAAAITAIILGPGTDPEILNLWTPEVWRSFETAHVEAVRFHHDFIGTEHLLLGLLQAEGSSVPKILGRMGVGCESVRAGIEKIVGTGGQSSAGQKLSCTPRAKRALQIAIREAKRGNSQRAGGEHLFLGLIREGSGVAAVVLNQLGVNTDRAREEVLRELSEKKDGNE